MAIDLDVREEMKEYLAELIRAGKVPDPKEAHPLLKRKFGRSLTVGEVYRIVRANEPGAREDQPSVPKPGSTPRKPRKAKNHPKAPGRPARTSAKPDDAAIRQEMKAYLADQVKAGKVSAPKDAHPLLKKKFGRSMSFGEVSSILGANRPGGPKATKKAGKKRGRPRKSMQGALAPAAKRGSRDGTAGKSEFAVLTPGQGPILAGNRRELIDRITSLVAGGVESSAIEVFRRLPVRITTSYEIGL